MNINEMPTMTARAGQRYLYDDFFEHPGSNFSRVVVKNIGSVALTIKRVVQPTLTATGSTTDIIKLSRQFLIIYPIF